MPEPIVQFDGVEYILPDGRPLLHSVTLSVTSGECVALLGRSGSGKTTLLRTVNGLVRPTAGSVRNTGAGVASLGETQLIELRRRTGYVIQETGLFPHMTIERNAGMALELAGMRADNRRERVWECLALAGLDPADVARRYPWQLSGGQRQRVGLARALAPDPKLLLLDEPFGALDPITRGELQTTLRELLRRLGKTALIVTHDLDEALYLAGRIVFLEQGSVVADLPSNEILASQNPAVRSYVRAVHRGADA
jgi:osmoprotectant transport system ATP-binding protein